MEKESPACVRISTAAAMVLGFRGGLFHRNATSPCINTLLTYDEGCAASCAYCGLAQKRPGAFLNKSFIRVAWDAYLLDDIITRIRERPDRVERVCISMVTRRKAVADTLAVVRRLNAGAAVPISALVSPTIMTREDFDYLRDAGVERIGVAVDAATPVLFGRYRGSGVGGPHRWDRYWQAVDEAVATFGREMVGVHLIAGLGETEEELARAIQSAYDRGALTHLFSFFPERDSVLADRPQAAAGPYRRVQLARYLINNDLARAEEDFAYDNAGRITRFGLLPDRLSAVIDSGAPFITSGCPDITGARVACNRPYSDSLPGPDIRNFPFPPDEADIQKIREELAIDNPVGVP